MFRSDLLKGKRILVAGGGTFFDLRTWTDDDWKRARADQGAERP